MSDEAKGWDAIDASCQAVYGKQEARHYGTMIKWRLGGNDPLDGVSIYEADAFWHYVSFGLTELYEKESEDLDCSGWGFELTFKLAKTEEEPPVWPVNLMQNLARYVFQSGNVFADGHHLDANGPIAADEATAMTALLFTHDPLLPQVTGPNGTFSFLQLVGITAAELSATKRWSTKGVLSLLAEKSENLVTALTRDSITDNPDDADKIQEGIKRDGSSMGQLMVSELSWSLQQGQVTLTVGANAALDLAELIPARLGFERPLFLLGPEQIIVFSSGETTTATEEDDALKLNLAPHDVQAWNNTVKCKEGTYQLTSDITVVVEKTHIRDKDGNVTDVIG